MRPAASSSLELRGARQRREDVEHHGVDAVLDGEGHGVADCLHVVGVGAEHEHAVAADPVLVQQADAFDDVVDGLRLLVAVERRLVDGLETEIDELAA